MAKLSWPKVPAAFVQKNLTGHKILGLALAGILYLICLSGTATVFYLDMQRWEAANIPDAVLTPEGVATAMTDTRAHLPKDAVSLGATTPTRDLPRLIVYAGEVHRGYDSTGKYIGEAGDPAVDGLTELHYILHLPSTIGLVVVGLGGIAITAFLFGGLLAHPRIFKDAFLWRFKAGARLNRSDLHNRFGVWAAPFHLIIAVTGALIGLSQIIVLVAGLSFYKGDTAKASAPFYGDMTVKAIEGRMDRDDLVAAFINLKRDFPDVEPDYVSLNNLNTDHESLTVWAYVPDRLVYGEQFEFDGKGRLVTRHYLPDGPIGKQAYASIYKLHFGSFGGVWVRWAYVVLGFGLTLICTTGMDIWLLKSAQKGRPYPRLHKGWAGFVWGTPLAIAVASVVCLFGIKAYVPVFWGVLAAATAAAVFARSLKDVSVAGQFLLAGTLAGLVAVHAMKFAGQSWAGVAMWVNLSLLALALGCAICGALRARQTGSAVGN
jgi:uncharacterized iron-regulated membrane protein